MHISAALHLLHWFCLIYTQIQNTIYIYIYKRYTIIYKIAEDDISIYIYISYKYIATFIFSYFIT